MKCIHRVTEIEYAVKIISKAGPCPKKVFSVYEESQDFWFIFYQMNTNSFIWLLSSNLLKFRHEWRKTVNKQYFWRFIVKSKFIINVKNQTTFFILLNCLKMKTTSFWFLNLFEEVIFALFNSFFAHRGFSVMWIASPQKLL